MIHSDDTPNPAAKRVRAWKAKHPDKAKQYRATSYGRAREAELAKARAYYANNRERLREKARIRAAAKRNEIRAYARTWVAKDRVRHRGYYLWYSAKIRARAKGLEFTIEVEDVVIPETCPVLGIPIIVASGQRLAPGAPSIDRMDNSLGYTPANIRVISHRANALKRDGTLEEFRLVVMNWTAR